jgi:hypothetical protein
MATFTTETVTTRTHRWIIPATEPWGAAAAEVSKAWEAARQAYWQAHGIPQGGPLPDNAISFHAAGDEIVISFDTEEPQR